MEKVKYGKACLCPHLPGSPWSYNQNRQKCLVTKQYSIFFFLPPPTPVNGEIRTTVSPSSWNWSQATLPESALECQIPRHFSGCETLGLPVYKSWNQIQANTQLL